MTIKKRADLATVNPKFINSLILYNNKFISLCQVPIQSPLYNIVDFVTKTVTLLNLPVIYFSFFSFYLGGELWKNTINVALTN